VKSAAKRDDLVLGRTADGARPTAGELECALVRLRARVAEKDGRGEGARDECVRELGAGSRAVQIRNVNQTRVHRREHCRANPGIVVAECIDGDAAGEIEIARSVLVEQLAPGSPYEFHGRAAVDRQQTVGGRGGG
jgi:hypothetical protein